MRAATSIGNRRREHPLLNLSGGPAVYDRWRLAAVNRKSEGLTPGPIRNQRSECWWRSSPSADGERVVNVNIAVRRDDVVSERLEQMCSP